MYDIPGIVKVLSFATGDFEGQLDPRFRIQKPFIRQIYIDLQI